jgi:hypothetical protein
MLVTISASELKARDSKLKIDQIKVNDRDVIWPSLLKSGFVFYEKLNKDRLPVNLEFPNGVQKISFRFNKLENKKISYRYKLIGQDSIWKKADVSGWVNFDNVKNGSLCFVLQEICNKKVIDEVRFKFLNKLTEAIIFADIYALTVLIFLIIVIIKIK